MHSLTTVTNHPRYLFLPYTGLITLPCYTTTVSRTPRYFAFLLLPSFCRFCCLYPPFRLPQRRWLSCCLQPSSPTAPSGFARSSLPNKLLGEDCSSTHYRRGQHTCTTRPRFYADLGILHPSVFLSSLSLLPLLPDNLHLYHRCYAYRITDTHGLTAAYLLFYLPYLWQNTPDVVFAGSFALIRRLSCLYGRNRAARIHRRYHTLRPTTAVFHPRAPIPTNVLDSLVSFCNRLFSGVPWCRLPDPATRFL